MKYKLNNLIINQVKKWFLKKKIKNLKNSLKILMYLYLILYEIQISKQDLSDNYQKLLIQLQRFEEENIRLRREN